MSGALPIEHRGAWVLQVHGTDVWCTSKGTLLMIRGKLLESGQGPLLPASEMTRVYFPGIDVAHLVDTAPPVAAIFCDSDVIASDLRGTASQPEIDYAAELPLCRACVRKASATRAAR